MNSKSKKKITSGRWAILAVLAVAFGAAIFWQLTSNSRFNALHPEQLSGVMSTAPHEQVATEDLIPPHRLSPDVSQPESEQVESRNFAFDLWSTSTSLLSPSALSSGNHS